MKKSQLSLTRMRVLGTLGFIQFDYDTFLKKVHRNPNFQNL